MMVEQNVKSPLHIAIIMDGNRRYGETCKGNSLSGHVSGTENVEKIIRAGVRHRVSHLTLFAFSTENWGRSREEVDHLMEIFRNSFAGKARDLVREGARIRFIGRRDRLPSSVVMQMRALEIMSRSNEKIVVTIALDYGGRDEIIRATKKLLWRVITFRANPFRFEETFRKCLDTGCLPYVDALIRTGGEHRLSNFLLWSTAYTELFFTEIQWPAFREEDFSKILEEFALRERRMGGDSLSQMATVAK